MTSEAASRPKVLDSTCISLSCCPLCEGVLQEDTWGQPHAPFQGCPLPCSLMGHWPEWTSRSMFLEHFLGSRLYAEPEAQTEGGEPSVTQQSAAVLLPSLLGLSQGPCS